MERYWKVCEKFCANNAACKECEQGCDDVFVPAHVAAGEWRSDIENAPRDGTYILACNRHGIAQTIRADVMHSVNDSDPGYVAAYAIINPPEAADA